MAVTWLTQFFNCYNLMFKSNRFSTDNRFYCTKIFFCFPLFMANYKSNDIQWIKTRKAQYSNSSRLTCLLLTLLFLLLFLLFPKQRQWWCAITITRNGAHSLFWNEIEPYLSGSSCFSSTTTNVAFEGCCSFWGTFVIVFSGSGVILLVVVSASLLF